MALWAFAIPFIAAHAPQLLPGLAPPPALLVFYSAANLAFCIGAVLLGIAALRAQTLPPEVSGVGAALIGAGILDAVNSVSLPDALWGLSQITSASSAFFLLISLVGFGVALMGRQQATVVQPTPVAIDVSSEANV
jgi:hypothetical protein